MFWSHTDEKTYQTWLKDRGFQIVETIFIPERKGGHTALLAQGIANQ